jgi:hypothetical protein
MHYNIFIIFIIPQDVNKSLFFCQSTNFRSTENLISAPSRPANSDINLKGFHPKRY